MSQDQKNLIRHIFNSDDAKRLNRRTERDVDGTYELVHSWYTDSKIDEICEILQVQENSGERACIEARWEPICQYAVSYYSAYPNIFPQPKDALIYFTLQALQRYHNTLLHGNRDDYDPSVRGAPSAISEFVDSRHNSVIDITKIP